MLSNARAVLAHRFAAVLSFAYQLFWKAAFLDKPLFWHAGVGQNVFGKPFVGKLCLGKPFVGEPMFGKLMFGKRFLVYGDEYGGEARWGAADKSELKVPTWARPK